jgi:uncharacterized protein YydD (DUF2326 family)
MKFRLNKLYSEPSLFTPVTFHSGINLILGEKVEDGTRQGRKVNGVGKSLCVEFIHFALLREFEKTRVARIPTGVLPDDFAVILDVSINDDPVQIRRRPSSPDEPIISYRGKAQTFTSLADGSRVLVELLFRGLPVGGTVSFRSLLSLLMRDETSEFIDIASAHAASLRIPPDPAPHLFLMGIDLEPYFRLLNSIKSLGEQTALVRKLKTELTNHQTKTLGDVAAELNQEKRDVELIDEGLAALEAEPAYALVEKELNELESKLANLRSQRKTIAYQMDQIRSLPQPEVIDETDVAIIYNRVKAGLGDLVTKSLRQAQEFKEQIMEFQRSLMKDEMDRLMPEHDRLGKLIRDLSQRHGELMRQIDQKGALQELRVGLSQAVSKRENFVRREAAFQQLKLAESARDDLRLQREMAVAALRTRLNEAAEIEGVMDKTVGDIHERIMGTRQTSFRIHLEAGAQRKHPVELELRIPDDRSHSVERTKVFVYDAALLFASCTQDRHPGFLLHDNIFDVDQDTLVQCLNFLNEQVEQGNDFQYVLTLNREKIEAEERAKLIHGDVDDMRRATLTKAKPFLGLRYQETSKKRKGSREIEDDVLDSE